MNPGNNRPRAREEGGDEGNAAKRVGWPDENAGAQIRLTTITKRFGKGWWWW